MRTFVEKYFENKPVEKLKRTITPSWTEALIGDNWQVLSIKRA